MSFHNTSLSAFISKIVKSLVFILFLGCVPEFEEAKYTVGFSQCTMSTLWRQVMLNDMKRELTFHPEISFIMKDANDNNDLQIQQIQELIDAKVDLLIVSPNESEPITPIVEKAFNSGIPVIVVDRNISSKKYTTFIGADNTEIGKIAGDYAGNLLKGKGQILEIWGLKGSSPALGRHSGFHNGVSKFKNIEIVKQLYGKWEDQKTKKILEKEIEKLPNVNLVYAHNDEMAVAAYEIFKKYDKEENVKFLGVDALPGEGGGIHYTLNGVLNATFLYPTGGEDAIDKAAKILKNEKVNKKYTLSTSIVDNSNAHIFKLQTDKITSHQNDIARLGNEIQKQLEIYKDQRIVVLLLIVSLVPAIVFGIRVYMLWIKNKIIAKKLSRKNLEVVHQRDQIKESILVAKTIQDAMLPKLEQLKNHFSDAFILFKSKDVVSGDFYWNHHHNGECYIAIVDCTGHGVPGAFMSMIGSSLLNRYIKELRMDDLPEILKSINSELTDVLEQEENKPRNGMDLILLKIKEKPDDEEMRLVEFVGIKSKLFYIQKNESNIEYLRGSKVSLDGTAFKHEIVSQKIELEKGSLLYLTTDGFIDQCNADRKRFGTKNLIQLMERHYQKPLSDQREKMEQTLLEYSEGAAQRDDITVVGVKL